MEVLTEAFLVTEQVDGKRQDRTLGWLIWIRIHALGERDRKKRSLLHDDQRVVFPPDVLQQDAIRGTQSTAEVPGQHQPRPHREAAVRLAAAPVHRLHRTSTDTVGKLVKQRTQRRVDVVLDMDSTLAVLRKQRAVIAFHILQRQWTTTTVRVLGDLARGRTRARVIPQRQLDVAVRRHFLGKLRIRRRHGPLAMFLAMFNRCRSS